MAAKEIRQSLRRGTFLFPFLAIQVLAVLAVATEFTLAAPRERGEPLMFNFVMIARSGVLWPAVFVVCGILMPLGGLAMMTQELGERNHELLLLTPLRRWPVVWGKFITLWGLSVVTFVSLLPYLVVRYMLGAIEWWDELACASSVLGTAAVVSAGALAASSFRRALARAGVLALFTTSTVLTCTFPLVVHTVLRSGLVKYHLVAVAAVVWPVALGLALARARLRLAVHAYEANPAGLLLGAMCFAPFAEGMLVLTRSAVAAALGLLGLAIFACYADPSPHLPGRR